MRITLFVILLTIIFFFSCSQRKQKNQTQPPREYSVLVLFPRIITVHHDFPATMQGQQVIEVRPMISGYIQEIYVNEGDHVKNGQLLFKIKNPVYEQEVVTARASIMRAESDVHTAEMDIEKIRPLVEKQIVSGYRLKAAELTLESRKAALAQAQAELVNAQTNLGYTNIRSPHDGIIGTIPFKVGALVGSNNPEPLTTLSDIDNVIAYFSWDEKRLLDFHSHSGGTTLEEKINDLPPATLILANASEYQEKGKIEMASGLISTQTGSATLKAIFPNPGGLIRSGASATIRIPETIDSALVFPQSATYELQNKYFVYDVGPDSTVSPVSFNPVPSDDGKFYIVLHGLNPGDRVVIEGVNSLRDGMKIIPREVDTTGFYKNIR
jgi:membrane fusion protein (multidrug efflux system)